MNIGTIYLYSFTDHREPRIFALNRPFTFVIIDNLTAMLLFAGRIVNPNKH